MARDQDDFSAQRPRPLPTVSGALLRHELQAERSRNIALLSVAGVVIVALLGFLFRDELLGMFSASNDPEGPGELQREEGEAIVAAAAEGTPAGHAAIVDSAAAPLAAQAGANRPAVPQKTTAQATVAETVAPEGSSSETQATGEAGTKVVRFGKARGFRDALVRAGVLGSDADAIVVALDKLVDFRRCRPEHELTLVRSDGGQLERFEYRTSRTDLYRATRTSSGFQAEKVEIPIETRRVAKGGHVRDSLGRALEHLGLGTSLVGAFVEAFERKVSFKKDTREGDAFRIVVDEQYIDDEFLGYGTVHAVEYSGERAGKLRGYWYKPKGQAGDFYDESGRAMNGGWLRTPLRYDHMSSPFNPKRRHPVLKRIMPHNGTDYAASTGTTVWAAADGTVTFAGYKGANGNLIGIKHDGGYETYYAHLSRINSGIKRGVRVTQRQPIGAVGTTGRSTGPHLHFALKRRGRFIDPLSQLNGPGKPLPGREAGPFKRLRQQLDKELEATALAAAPPESAPEPAADEETFEEDHLDL